MMVWISTSLSKYRSTEKSGISGEHAPHLVRLIGAVPVCDHVELAVREREVGHALHLDDLDTKRCQALTRYQHIGAIPFCCARP